MRLLAVLLLTAACGGSAKPAKTSTDSTSAGSGAVADPIPRTAGPECTVVADRLAIAAAPDRTDEQAKIRADAATRCREDQWSDEARSCFAAVENEAEFEGCVGMLTPEQKAKLPGRSAEAPTEGAAPADPVAPMKEPASAKKKPGGTRSADPEEGGE